MKPDRTSAGPDGAGRGRRWRLVTALALVALLVPSWSSSGAQAAPVAWYRTAAKATPTFASLASGPGGGSSFATTVDHGGNAGAYLFDPGRTVTVAAGFPGTSASGAGYATTNTYTGSLPAGTWRFDATVRTDTPAGTAEGVIGVAVYVGSGAASRRVAFVQGSTNVLAGPGDRDVSLSADLPELVLDAERVITEWYLVVQRADAAAAGASTALQHGASTDTVTAPGSVAPAPLEPPGTLTVAGVGDNQVDLTWEPSDDGRVTGYAVRRATGPSGPWTDVATVAGTGHSDRGLSNGVRYYHSVVAVAADGTRSSSSNSTSAVPSDTQAPASPSNVAVSPAGSFRLTVTWGASGSADVVGYEVQRSGSAGGPFTRVAGPVVATSFTDEGLPSGSTWHYRLVALDDDGLRSSPTVPAAGTVAPSPPDGLRVAAVADGAVALEWSGVAGATEYGVERGTGGAFAEVGRTSATSFTEGGLTNGTTYTYRVRAIDPAGGASSPSDAVRATPRDTGAPAPPTGLDAQPKGRDEVVLTWTASASPSVVGYRVLRAREDGPFEPVSGLIGRTRYEDGPLPVGVRHRYQVVAEDASGVRSIPATASYTVPPAAPGNLRITGLNESTVQLRWDATDDPRAGYRVLRSDDGPGGPYTAVSGLVRDLTFTDAGLLLGAEYHYVVQAEAVDGTRSGSSNRLRVVPVNGPPTPPTGLVVRDTGAGGQLSLSWPESIEPDVVRYRVERSANGSGWASVATTSATTYLDTGLVNGQTYTYRLVAIDSVGFASDPSEPVSATPTDTDPPAAPGQPTVSQLGTSLQIQWPPVATAVTYVVSRATGPSGPFARIGTADATRSLRDDDVARGVTYHYVVQAVDAAGNVSPRSAVASGLVRIAAVVPVAGDAGSTPGAGGGGTTGGLEGGEGPLFPPSDPDGTPSLDPDAPAPGTTQEPPVAAPDPAPDDPSGADNDAVDTDTIFVAAPEGPPAVEEGSAADEALRALSEGDLRRAIERTAEDVADKVGDVALAFRVPLVLLLLLGVYVVVQGRIDRNAVSAVPEAATGGEDDDVEYVL